MIKAEDIIIKEKYSELKNLVLICEAMDEFAELRHQAKLKLLDIPIVSNRRELLLGYNEYLEGMYNAKCLEDDDVDLYLKTKYGC